MENLHWILGEYPFARGANVLGMIFLLYSGFQTKGLKHGALFGVLGSLLMVVGFGLRLEEQTFDAKMLVLAALSFAFLGGTHLGRLSTQTKKGTLINDR